MHNLRWTKVSRYWVVSLSDHSKSKPDVEGFEDLISRQVPAGILEVKETNGWTHFGQLNGFSDIFIAGPNLPNRRRIAKALKESGSSDRSGLSENPGTRQGPSSHAPEGADAKDGGVKAFFQAGSLHLRASRYDKGGADPDLILEEIRRVTDAAQWPAFWAVVCLQGLWWAGGTHKSRRDSSDRCMKVLSGLLGLGCIGLEGELDLSQNDLDDEFLDLFLALLNDRESRLTLINLDENRITTEGAMKLVQRLQSSRMRPVQLQLMNNPIDNSDKVAELARSASLCCRVGPAWTWQEGEVAVCNRDSWWTYFFGPVQLLRLKILELPREMQMVECPLCDCVLKTDLSAPGNPQYTVAGNLASHLCGDRHRKKIVSLLESSQQSLPSILIVSKLWSFTLHPLTGETQCIQKHTGCSASPNVMQEPDVDVHQVQVRAEATPIRAVVWHEGHEIRESVARQAEPELAYEILEQRQQYQSSNQIQIEDRMLNIKEVEYTQTSIGCRFQNGWWLERLIDDLDSGRVDPRTHETMRLEVVFHQGKYYSNDNRRLYCLKKHQENQQHTGWEVRVAARVHIFPQAFNRFVERFCERQRLCGNDPDNIRVRGPPSRSRR